MRLSLGVDPRVGVGRSSAVPCVSVRIPDAALQEVRHRGFVLLEGFLSREELEAAQEALWLHYPKPEEYFAHPERYPQFAGNQFAGVEEFPYRSWDLNHLAFHPDLVDAVERYLGSCELHLYKVELWAKYAGAADYDQPLHRDYGSHSLVVPRLDGRYQQITTFVYLSDVTEEDGPTRLVPLKDGEHVPFTPLYIEPGSLADVEVSATGPAGSLLVYRTDVLHRGSDIRGSRRGPLLPTRRLPAPRHDVGREDGLAQAVTAAVGQAHPSLLGPRAGPVRVSEAGGPVLGRPDPVRRRPPLSRDRSVAVSTRPRGGERASRGRSSRRRDRDEQGGPAQPLGRTPPPALDLLVRPEGYNRVTWKWTRRRAGQRGVSGVRRRPRGEYVARPWLQPPYRGSDYETAEAA